MIRNPLADLTPAQRSALAARQADPRARALVLGVAAPARPRPASRRPTSPVEASAYVDAADVWPGVAIVLHLRGLRLVNVANAREHWSTRKRRVTREHAAVNAAVRLAPMWSTVAAAEARRWVVTITREGRGLCDDDGLAISAKGVRDAVAAALGVDDGPTGPVTWRYGQRRAKGYAVEVRVEVAK